MFNQRQHTIIQYFREHQSLSSQEVLELHKGLKIESSLVTVKRDLAQLAKLSIIDGSGKGRSVRYSLSTLGKILSPIDSHSYCQQDLDKRVLKIGFDFALLAELSQLNFLILEEELLRLNKSTEEFRRRCSTTSQSIHKKELERFIIELSWKSSKIEGNTYSILDTERLIKDGIEAVGKTREEAIMILNHKKAFNFVLEQKDKFRDSLSQGLIEQLHRLIVADLDIDVGIRSSPVGITGTKYRPLDNLFQIKEAFQELISCINRKASPFERSLLAQAALPYIQPFSDGNKRTSRLLANALLLAHDCAPISYRSVDENSYKEAILVFYELGNLWPLKQIFVEQYLFSAENYNLGTVRS